MKHILKFVAIGLSIGLAVSLTARSAAQDLGSLGKQAQSFGGLGNMSGLVQKLHLSPQQLQQVLPIFQKESPKLQSISGNSSLTGPQKVAQTKAVQQQSDSKLKSILSPQQFLSLQNFRSEQLQGLMHGAIPH